MKFQVVCTSARSHETGQRVKFAVPLPPPLPAADGTGAPVYNPPPISGGLQFFITSPERQELLRKVAPLRARNKVLAHQIAVAEASVVAEEDRPAHERQLQEMVVERLHNATAIEELEALLATDLGEVRYKEGEDYMLELPGLLSSTFVGSAGGMREVGR